MSMATQPAKRLTDSRLANLSAQTIHDAFLRYRTEFRTITQRAYARFLHRQWHEMRADAAQRLALYRHIVDELVEEIRELLGEREQQQLVWVSMKAVYSGLIVDHDDWELAETFFNSVTRRIFATVGVDPQIEFVDTDYDTPPNPPQGVVYRAYGKQDSDGLLRRILTDFFAPAAFADLDADVALAADALEEHLRDIGALRVAERVDVVRYPFFRGMAAYIVGRLYSASHVVPLVLALHNTADGIEVDCVLLDEDSVSILFSFARAYFHVEVERPYDLVRFLKSIMPRKRRAELYISLGFNKHGKTELYRDLLSHLAYSEAQFDLATGARGMVMRVFTMPDYDMVFKVIKDRFSYPKSSTRDDVMGKYDFVFKHDRAGRLIDAQSFEHLVFCRERFTDVLLEELRETAGQTVQVAEAEVVVQHCYVERRVIPLDIYIQEAHPEDARAAIADYGKAIKDLAASNVFPGDMLLKNFGVTRHGRVVFYDYDELRLLTECRFRRIPPPRTMEDEMSPEPWFHVAEGDVFPEEFGHFLGLSDELRQIFMEYHADLLEVDFWRGMQKCIEEGELVHILPYREDQRLRAGQGATTSSN